MVERPFTLAQNSNLTSSSTTTYLFKNFPLSILPVPGTTSAKRSAQIWFTLPSSSLSIFFFYVRQVASGQHNVHGKLVLIGNSAMVKKHAFC